MKWGAKKATKHSAKGSLPGLVAAAITWALATGRIDSPTATFLTVCVGVLFTAFGTDLACLQTKLNELSGR